MARPRITITRDIAEAVGRVHSNDPQFREFIVPTGSTGELLEAFADLEIVSGLIYCIGGLNANGTPQQLASPFYIGRCARYLLDSRSAGEESVPFIIAETATSELQSAKVYFRGDAGDRLVLVYRT